MPRKAKPRGKLERLTEQQLVFCRAYVRLGSARSAAREADYAFPEQLGYKLLRRRGVREEIERIAKQVNASRDPVLIADANEVRQQVTWIMRHGETDEVKLKAAMVLAKLIGMGSEFNPGARGLPGAPQVLDATDYDSKSRAELEDEGKVVALRVLGTGDGRR